MGNLRKLQRKMNQPNALIARTHFIWNDVEICLVIPFHFNVDVVVNDFREFMALTIERANVPNMRDLYAVHADILDKLKKGESLLDGKIQNN
jgi:hypothetical protein